MVGGDFNCVVRPSEKVGGAIPSVASMAEFNAFACSAGLLDAGFSGVAMTWNNNRTWSANIQARLDRVLLNNLCQSEMPQLLVKHLPRGPSDHAPMLLSFESLSSSPSRFIFQKMWVSHSSFLQVVSEAWNQVQIDHPNAMVRLFIKLKAVKNSLYRWNKEVFGEVTQNVRLAESEVELKQTAYELNPSTENRSSLNAANATLRQALHREEVFWNQKSRVDWIESGDRNTSFYHAVAQCNRRRCFIIRLKLEESGTWCEDQDTLRQQAESYFKNFSFRRSTLLTCLCWTTFLSLILMVRTQY